MTYYEKIMALVKSRRFQATVGSVLAVVFQDFLGLSIEQSLMLVAAIQSWVVGDSLNKTA